MDDQGRCSEGTSRARPRPWGSKLFGRPDPVGPALVELRALRSRSPRRNSVQPPASEPVLQCSRDLHRVPESADPLAKRSGPTLKVTADSQCASGRGSGGEEAQRLLFDRFEDIHEQRADDARVRSLPPPIPRAQPGGVRGGGGGGGAGAAERRGGGPLRDRNRRAAWSTIATLENTLCMARRERGERGADRGMQTQSPYRLDGTIRLRAASACTPKRDGRGSPRSQPRPRMSACWSARAANSVQDGVRRKAAIAAWLIEGSSAMSWHVAGRMQESVAQA